MPEGVTVIFLRFGAGAVGWAAVMLGQDVAHRRRVRQRERMTLWQRRVNAGLEQAPGFEVGQRRR